jgi:hypothetical protein
MDDWNLEGLHEIWHIHDPRVHQRALNWEHSDTAGLPQLAGELFTTRAGIRIVGVPYRSGGESGG